MAMSRVKRINRGRGHSYLIDGRPAVGVTTAMGVLGKPALINWAANITAAYAVDHWDQLTAEPPSKRLDILKRARYADVDQASRRGTDVHALAEKLVQGGEVDVPDELAGHVESTVKFLNEWEPEPILTETVVAHLHWRYCGTADGVFRLRDGSVMIYDWKTSRSGLYAESALQLAAYAHAEVYLDNDGVEQPMSALGIAGGLGVHIRSDGYDVYRLDISDAVFKDFLHCLWCYRMTVERMDGWKSESIAAPPLEVVT
jgi:hypothetical protein